MNINFSQPFDKLSTTKKYAQSLAIAIEVPVHVFKVPEDSEAYKIGMRYGTFKETEKKSLF